MAKYKKKLDDDIRCPLEYGLAIFGGNWKSRIISVLSAAENSTKGRVYVDTKRKICCAYFAEYLPMVRCFL